MLNQRGGFQPFDEGEYGFNPVNTEGQWNVFYIVLGERAVPEYAAPCPKTAAVLRTLPNLALSAMFSALIPGTHLWAHCGPTNAFISQSMGLIVPPGCTIRVGDVERTWREGECLVFDNTYEHEVWNRGTGTRFILLTDTWHPELILQRSGRELSARWAQRMILTAVMSIRSTTTQVDSSANSIRQSFELAFSSWF